MTATTFTQRLNTSGGVAPPEECTSLNDLGKQAFVPYTADYFFYTDGRRCPGTSIFVQWRTGRHNRPVLALRVHRLGYGDASTRHHGKAKKAPGSSPHSFHAAAK